MRGDAVGTPGKQPSLIVNEPRADGGVCERMGPTRRAWNDSRAWRPQSARDARLTWRCPPADRVVRWIEVAGRKRAGSVQETPAEPASPPSEDLINNVVALTWAQTSAAQCGEPIGSPAIRTPSGSSDARPDHPGDRGQSTSPARALRGIARRGHRVICRQAVALSVALRVEPVAGQVALQRLIGSCRR